MYSEAVLGFSQLHLPRGLKRVRQYVDLWLGRRTGLARFQDYPEFDQPLVVLEPCLRLLCAVACSVVGEL